MSKKKTTKKKVAAKKPATKTKTVKQLSTRPNLTEGEKTVTVPLSDVEIQGKYDECVSILHQVHNAIALCLSMTNEYDNKSPVELIQYALDQYVEYSKLSPEEVEALRAESEDFVKALETMVEASDTDMKPTSIPTKKELLN